VFEKGEEGRNLLMILMMAAVMLSLGVIGKMGRGFVALMSNGMNE
jgi:hypothetical protein